MYSGPLTDAINDALCTKTRFIFYLPESEAFRMTHITSRGSVRIVDGA